MKDPKLTVSRVVVEGEATFSVTCKQLKGMVTLEQSLDHQFMQNWFLDKATTKIMSLNSMEISIGGPTPDVEGKYIDSTTVEISEEIANTLTGDFITEDQWKQIQTLIKKRHGGLPAAPEA
ncbi:hypothetical protein [Paenibacillus taichungensis]|uniref:hypothetical protein n=1 Tax=Paenibacillus taichungensis TaxID=484184 RepID=UPI0035DF1D51